MCVQTSRRPMPRRPPALALPGPAPVSPPRPLPFAGRSRLPEIFTFDLEALPAAAPPATRRPANKRPRRVLYPAQTRRNRYLPAEERSPALRALYLLCLVICVQICLEEGEQQPPSALQDPRAALPASAPQEPALRASALQEPRPSLQEAQPALRLPESAVQELPSALQLAQSALHEPAVALQALQHHRLQEPHFLLQNLTCYPLQGKASLTF